MKPSVNSLCPLSVSKVPDPSEFQSINRHTCSCVPKGSVWGRCTTCRPPWKSLHCIPNSQLSQAFSPSPGKRSNTISILHSETYVTWPRWHRKPVLASVIKPVIFCLVLWRVAKEITEGKEMLVSNYTTPQQCHWAEKLLTCFHIYLPILWLIQYYCCVWSPE